MNDPEREKLLLGRAYAIFVAEVAIKLERLSGLLHAPASVDSGARDLLRIDMHTMKGGAGIFGLVRMSEISGTLEKLFHGTRPIPDLTGEISKLVDQLKKEVDKMPPPAQTVE